MLIHSHTASTPTIPKGMPQIAISSGQENDQFGPVGRRCVPVAISPREEGSEHQNGQNDDHHEQHGIDEMRALCGRNRPLWIEEGPMRGGRATAQQKRRKRCPMRSRRSLRAAASRIHRRGTPTSRKRRQRTVRVLRGTPRRPKLPRAPSPALNTSIDVIIATYVIIATRQFCRVGAAISVRHFKKLSATLRAAALSHVQARQVASAGFSGPELSTASRAPYYWSIGSCCRQMADLVVRLSRLSQSIVFSLNFSLKQ